MSLRRSAGSAEVVSRMERGVVREAPVEEEARALGAV
jgi:hypothetical protein